MKTLRRIIYNCFYSLDHVFGQKTKLVIFCYHGFASDSWRYSVNLETFKQQLDYLLQQGYTPISLAEIAQVINDGKQLNKPSFVITIDDGYVDVFQLKELFKEFKITPTIFVLSEPARANRKELDSDKKFLTTEQLLDLQKAGWEIASHGATHADFWQLTDAEIENEVVESKEKIETELGIKVKYFAYPRGRYNAKILAAVKKAGYELGVTMDDGFINSKTNPLIVPRVGVDRTHTFAEFKAIFLPSSIRFRKFIKENFGVIG